MTPVPPAWVPSPIVEWLLFEGWRIREVPALLQTLAERLCAEGVPLWRLFCLVPTLHPQFVGSGHRWVRGAPRMFRGFGYHGVRDTPAFLANPLKLVILDGYAAVRRRLDRDYRAGEFPLLDELKAQGATDYVCMPITFADGRRSAVSFASDRPGGFDAAHLAQFDSLLPVLARLIELAMLRDTAVNLLDTYVGRDAGARILSGQITRGSAETLYAAIWYADLRGFTALSEVLPRDALVALLNDYFEAMAAPVQRHGGQVLKFIGDAVLGTFPVDGGCATHSACARALDATAEAEAAMAALNAARAGRGEALLEYGLALHLGDVSYGNIGAADRLDFTVIGRAVNLASRLEGLCKTLGHRPLLSAPFAAACGRPVRPIGRYPLRGVAEPQEVFAMAAAG